MILKFRRRQPKTPKLRAEMILKLRRRQPKTPKRRVEMILKLRRRQLKTPKLRVEMILKFRRKQLKTPKRRVEIMLMVRRKRMINPKWMRDSQEQKRKIQVSLDKISKTPMVQRNLLKQDKANWTQIVLNKLNRSKTNPVASKIQNKMVKTNKTQTCKSLKMIRIQTSRETHLQMQIRMPLKGNQDHQPEINKVSQ
jgi:hypothetical protein